MKNVFLKIGLIFTFIACLFSSNILHNSRNSFTTYADETIISQSFDGVEGLWEDTVTSSNDSSSYVEGISREIKTAEDLAIFAKEVNSGKFSSEGIDSVMLMADIDLGGKFWTPIGNSGYSFEGTFDGNGYTIYNLNISYEFVDASYYGLFGLIGDQDNGNAEIRNLILKNFNIKANKTAGALVGSSYLCNISKIAVESGTITTTGGNLGGVIGSQLAQGSSVSTSYVSNNVTISNFDTSETSKTGIIVGNNGGATVRNCYGWNDKSYSIVGTGTKGTNVYSYNTFAKALIEISDVNNDGKTNANDLPALLEKEEWGNLVNNQFKVSGTNYACPVLKGVGNYTINLDDITKKNNSNASFQYARTEQDTKTNFTDSLIIPLDSSYEIYVVPEKGSTLAEYSIAGEKVTKTLQEQTSSAEQSISLQSSGAKIDGLNTNRQKIVNLDVIIDKRTIRLDSTKFIPYDFYNLGDGIVETKPNTDYYGLSVNTQYNHQEITYMDATLFSNISKEFVNVEESSGVQYARVDQVFYVDVRVGDDPFSSVSVYKPVNYSGVFNYIKNEINTGIKCSLPNETSSYDRFAITFNTDYAGVSSGSEYIPLAYTSQYVAELNHDNITSIKNDIENQTYYSAKTYYAYISKHNSSLTTTENYFENVVNPKGYTFDGYYKNNEKMFKAVSTTNPYSFSFDETPFYHDYVNLPDYHQPTVVYEARWEIRDYNYELLITHTKNNCDDQLEDMGLVIYNKTQEKVYSYNSGKVSQFNLHVGDEILIFNTKMNSNIARNFTYTGVGVGSNFKVTVHSIIEYSGTLYDAISVLMIDDYVEKNTITMAHELEINSSVNTNVEYTFKIEIPSLSTDESTTYAEIKNVSSNQIETDYGSFHIFPSLYANGTYTILNEGELIKELVNINEISSDKTTVDLTMPYGYVPLIIWDLKEGVDLNDAIYYYEIYDNGKYISGETLEINKFYYDGDSVFARQTCYPILLDRISGEQVYSTVDVTFSIEPQEIEYTVNIYLDNKLILYSSKPVGEDLYKKAFSFGDVYDYNTITDDVGVIVKSSSDYPSMKIVAYKEYTMTIDSEYEFTKDGITYYLSMFELDKVSGAEYIEDSTFKFTTSSNTSKTIDIYLKRKTIDLKFEVVELNDAKGSVSPESTSILINDSIELDGYDIKFSDTNSTVTASTDTSEYKFEGYFYDKEGKNPVFSGDRLTSNTTIYAIFNLKDVEVSVYADWIGNDVTETIKPYISYNGEKGTTVKVPYGESFEIGVENEAYFKTWNVYLEGDLDTAVSTDQISTGDANFVVVITGFTVKFMSNGGEFDDGTSEKEVDNIAVKNLTYDYSSFPSASDLIRTGYTFIGWGTSETSGVDIDEKTVVNIENPVTTLYAQWKINTYELSYSANGGDSTPNSVYVNYGEEVELADAITRSGYIFSGWKSNIPKDDKTYDANSTFKMPASDVTMSAVWTKESYNLVFDENGGDEVEDKAYSYEGTLPTTTKSGYKFIGWCLDEDNDNGKGDIYTKVGDWGNDGDTIYLYAKWESQIYKVTLDNGVTTSDSSLGNVTTSGLTTIYVKYGTKDFYEDEECTKLITSFAVFTNDYLSFLGYADKVDASSVNYIQYKDKSFTVLKNWDKTEETTLYAVYAFKDYKINFEVQDVTNAEKFTSLQDSETYSVSVNTVLNIDAIKENNIKTGYEIISYKTNRTDNVISLFGTDNLQITLQYKRNSYTVSFDSNGGSEVSNKTVYYGLTYGELETPYLRGYSFDGWKYDGVVITSSSIVETARDHELVAAWKNVLYEVTLNANTGSLVSGLTVVYAKYDTYDYYKDSDGNTSISNFAIYEKQGYDFLGYATTTNASAPDYIRYTDNAFEILKAWDLTKDTTLYALWQGKEITISFETFGGEELESITGVVGSLYGNLPSAVKMGYVFNNWYLSYTDNNGSGTKITASSTIETTDDHTLYANYSVENLYINFSSTLEKVYDGESVEGELKLYNNSNKTQNDLLSSEYFTKLSYTYEIKKGDISVKTGNITSNTITINNFAKNVSDSGDYKIIVTNSLTTATFDFTVTINKYELDFANEDLSKYLTKEYDTSVVFTSKNISINGETFKVTGILSSADEGERSLSNITLENVANFIPNNYSYKNLSSVTVTKKSLKITVSLSVPYSTAGYELDRSAEVDGYIVNYTIVIPEKTQVGTYDISKFEIIVNTVATKDNWQTTLNKNYFDITFSGSIEIKLGTITNTELAKILSFENDEIVYDGEYHNLEVQDNGTDYVYSVSYEIYLGNEYQGIQVKDAGKYEVRAIVSVENFDSKTIKAILTIKPREIKVIANENVYSKTYDGTVNINIDLSSNVEIYDILSGNVLNDSIVKDYKFADLNLTAKFADKNSGENIQILFSVNSSNYSLTNQPENKVGKINKKDLTISLKETFVAKIFDRKPIGSVDYNKFDFTGLITGETVTSNFNINLVNAGNYDLFSISSLIQNSSSVLKNYNITYSGTIRIQKAQITLSTPTTSVTYNGEEQEIAYITSSVDSVNINADEMTIEYYLNGEKIGTNGVDNIPTNAENYIARFIPSENFIILSGSNLKESIDVLYNIEKRHTGEISILEQEKVYDGQPFEKIFTSNAINEKDQCIISNDLANNQILTLTVKTNDSSAGSYLLGNSIVSAVIKDQNGIDVTRNYSFGSYVGVIKITQKPYVLSSELLTEYIFVYDKTVKTLPNDNPVFEEANTLTNGEFVTEIKYFDINGNETQCINAGTYRVTVKITSNNYTFKNLTTKLVINQRGLYTNQNFDKIYDGTSDVVEDITVYDNITKEVLSIDDDVRILGSFINNYDNKTLVSSANDNLKIYLRLDGQDRDNYVLVDYDISAKIGKRKTTITVSAEEIYTAQTIKVSYTKMYADNLVSGHTLNGFIDFQTCINVGEYDVSKAGYSLDRFDILNNKLSLKQNYDITLQGTLNVLPAVVTLTEITDITETKIYDGKLQSVTGFVFENSLTPSCVPSLEDFNVSYLDEEFNSKDPINVGKYFVKVIITNENFTFKDGQNNIDNFTYTTSQMEISKRNLNITTESGQEVFTGSDQYKIILPGVLKIVNLVENQTLQGELTINVSVSSATYNISNFEITKPIKTFSGSEETTNNYNITISGLLTITKVDIDYSGLENLVYNGQIQVLRIGEYNSVNNPDMFANIKNSNGEDAQPINAGTYTFDFVDINQNITPLTFTIQKLNVYGEVDILNKEYDKTSALNKNAKINIYYYENNDIGQSKKYFDALGTNETLILTGKYMNTTGTVEKTDTGKATIVFEMSGDTDNFNLVNTNISANIDKKKIVLNIGNVEKYYDNQKYIFRNSTSNFTNTSEVLCTGDSIPSSATVSYEYYNANEVGYNLGENYTFENFGSRFLLLYDVSFSGTLIIKKAEVELDNFTIDNVKTNTSVYNDEEKSLLFDYEIVNGYETDLAFDKVLKVFNDENFVNTASAINVGQYRLEVYLNQGFTQNYKIIGSNYFDFTISQKKINSINITEQTFVHEYNKTEFEVNNIISSDLCENHTITLVITTSSDEVGSYSFDDGITSKTVIVLENNEDKTLNYDLSDCEFSGSLVIIKADIVDIELEDETYVYDKQVKTLKGFDDNGNENLKYILKPKYFDIEPEFSFIVNGKDEEEIALIDAGIYEIQIIVTDKNYNDYVITSTLTIEQKVIYIDKNAVFSKIYDGEEFATSELLSTIKIKTIENDQEVDLADIYNITFKASYYKESTFTNVQYDVCDKCFVKIEYVYDGNEKASNYKEVDDFIPTAKITERNLILTFDGTSVFYYTGEAVSIDVSNFTADNLAKGDVLSDDGDVTFKELINAGDYSLLNQSYELNFKILKGSTDKTLNYDINFAGNLTINQAEVVISNLVYSNQDKIYDANLVTFEYDTTAKNGSIVIGELEIETNITYRSFKEQNIEAISNKEFSSISDIKNAGEYKLEFVIAQGSNNYVIVDTNIFDLTISKKLEYVDLNDFEFNKIYGEADNLTLDYVTSLNENIIIQLSRESGEVVGNYDLYLDENYFNNNYEITLLNTTDAFEIISSTDIVQVVLSDESLNSFAKIYDGLVVQDILNPTLSYTTYLNNELVDVEVTFEKLVFDKSSSDVGYYKLNMAESVVKSQNYSLITIANFENIFFTINKLGIEIEDNNSFDKVYDGTTNVIVDMSKIKIYLYETSRGNEIISDDLRYPSSINATFESKDCGTQNIVFDMKNYSVKNTTAQISKAQVEVRITNGLTAPYGYQIDNNYFDFDIYVDDTLDNTLKQEIKDNIVLEVEHNSNISTSGFIKAGTYDIASSSELSNIDFTVNGTIIINKKVLDIIGNFDKIFDNTSILNISNIESINFVSQDDVNISSANYESKEVGRHLITFELDGYDKNNYSLPEIYGEIRTKYITVKFDYNENELLNSNKLVGKVAQKIYDYNSNFTDLPIVSHEGYNFIGYVLTYGENQTITINETIKIQDYVNVSLDEITLKANWDINKYIVTLNYNSEIGQVYFEENISEKQFDYGSLIDLSNLQINIIDYNYEFYGYLLGTEKVEYVTVSKSIAINCEFTKIKSNLTLNSNGGVFTSDQITALKNAGFIVSENITATKICEAGNKVSLSGLSASKTGYTFLGWTLDENGGNPITEILWKNNGLDISLYANYTATEYKLYISAGQGYFDNNISADFVPEEYNNDGQITKVYRYVEYDSAIGEIVEPIREGFEFDYWVYEDSGEIIKDITSVIYQTAKDRTIVAVYNQTVFNLYIGDSQEKITYSVYINNSLIGTSKSLRVVAGENDSVKIEAIADKGYNLTNDWFIIGSEEYQNAWSIQDNQIIFTNLKFLIEDVNIYTTVEANTNVITLLSNDYSKGNVKANDTITHNGFITINAKTEEIVVFEVIAEAGYEFTGEFEITGNATVKETAVLNVYNLVGFNEDISVEVIFAERTNKIKVIADSEKGLIFSNGELYSTREYSSKTNSVINITVKTNFGYELEVDSLKWQEVSSFDTGSAIFVITSSDSGYYNVSISNFVSDGSINIVYANQKFAYKVNYAIIENGNLVQNTDDFNIQIFDGENEILDSKLPYKTNIKVQVSKVKEGYHLYNVSNNTVNIDSIFNNLENLQVYEDYITFDVLNAIEMTLIFEINKYEITLISNDYGTLNPTSLYIAHGLEMDFNVVEKFADGGYEFDKFVEVIDNNEVDITDLTIKGNRTFKAIFIPKSLDLSIFAGLREADKYDGAITEEELFNSLTVNVDDENVYSTTNDQYDGRNYILTKTQTGKTITLTVNLPVGYEVDKVYATNIKTINTCYVTYEIVTENSISTIYVQGFTEECDIVVSFKAKLFDIEITFIKEEDLSKFANAATISLTDTSTIDDQVSYIDGVMVVKVKYNAKLYLRANINLGYVLYNLDSEHIKTNKGISVTAQDVEPFGTYAFIRDYEFAFDCRELELNALNKIQIYVKELVYKITFNTNIDNDKVNSPVYYAQVKYGCSTLEEISDLDFNLAEITSPTTSPQWKFMGWMNFENFGTIYHISDGKIYSIDSLQNRVDKFYGTGAEKDYKCQENYELTLYAVWDANYHQVTTTYIPNLAENSLISNDQIFVNNVGRIPNETKIYYISTYNVEVVVPTYKQGYLYKGYEVVFTGQGADVVQSGNETEFTFIMPSCDVELRFIYEIEVSINANEKGLVAFDNADYKSSNSKNFSYYGTMTEEQFIYVYAKASEGYEFSYFEINGSRLTSDNSSYSLVTNADNSLATLTIKALSETLNIRAIFIGRQVEITFTRFENAWVNKVNNISLTYNDNIATILFRVDDTLNFNFDSVSGYKFSEFEDYGRINEFTLTKEHLQGLTFNAKSEGIQIKFRITARENGAGSDAVVITNGTKLGETWTLTYPSKTTINFNLFERYEFAELITLNGKSLTYNGLSFEISTQNSLVYLDESHTNEIVIQVKKKMWMEYGESLYKNGTRFTGYGTESKPYIISSVEDLAIMAYLINTYENSNSLSYASSTYKLKISINLYEKFWTPIGVAENPFNGTFIFGSFKVKDIFLTRKYAEIKYDGLFGVCGDNAKFITENTDFTILYLVIGGVLLIIILIITFIVVRDRLKRRKMERQGSRSLVG